MRNENLKINACQDMLDINGYMNFIQAAKVIFGEYSQKYRNQLFKFCRDNGYLMDNNEPSSKYVDCGYFKSICTRKYNPKLKRHFPYSVTLMSTEMMRILYQRIHQSTLDV